MTRQPKPIPMLDDMKPEYDFSGGARGQFFRPGHARRLPVANPPSEFSERVKAEHIKKASVEIRRAYYFATEFAGAKFRQVVSDVTSHATVAGEYAAYSGRQLEEWHREFAKEFSIPTIIDAFDEKFNATIELLTTPDEELEDLVENPPRDAFDVLRELNAAGYTLVRSITTTNDDESTQHVVVIGNGDGDIEAMGADFDAAIRIAYTKAMRRQALAATRGRQNPSKWPRSQVQSLLFDVGQWSESEAKRWAHEHGFKYGDVDTTDGFHHLRQSDPIRGRPCRTVEFDERGTIKARICAA